MVKTDTFADTNPGAVADRPPPTLILSIAFLLYSEIVNSMLQTPADVNVRGIRQSN